MEFETMTPGTNAAPAAGGAPAPAGAAPAPTAPQPGPEGTPAAAQTGGDQKPDKQDRFEAAQQMIGKQGKEIGDLRAANRELQTQLKQLATMQQEFIKSQQPQAPDITATINEKLSTGEISVAQALKMQADYMNEHLGTVAQQQAQRAIQIDRWKQAHPEFEEMLATGEIEEYARTHPHELFHDEVDVYRAIKAEQAAAKYTDLESKIPTMVSQAAEKAAADAVAKLQQIAQGADATGAVMPTTGSGIRDQNQKPPTGTDYKTGLYEASKRGYAES